MNKAWIIAGVAVLFLFTRKKKEGPGTATGGQGATNGTSQVRTPTSAEIAQEIANVRGTFGVDIARNVERIYRLETANFTSEQFRRCNSPGMIAVDGETEWPWGWAKRGTTPEMFAPLVFMTENQGGRFAGFIAFKEFCDAAEYVAKFLRDYGNNAGRWKSTNPTLQQAYVDALQQFATPYAG
jgi:hypothetical protein